MAKMQKAKEIIGKLPQQKQHLDFLSALLTIPVLVTVILVNLNNLDSKKVASSITPTPTPDKKVTSVVVQDAVSRRSTGGQTNVDSSNATTPQPSISQTPCTKGIPPVDITFPTEGESVNNNPLCIDISYSQDSYCGIVWSYKINDSKWSDYGNNDVCLYNLPQGNNKVSLQVKSIVGMDSKEIDRNFIYTGSTNAITPTPSPTPQPSGPTPLPPTPTPSGTLTN